MAAYRVLSLVKDFLHWRTGYRLYTSEVQKCLSVGLLLAVVQISV